MIRSRPFRGLLSALLLVALGVTSCTSADQASPLAPAAVSESASGHLSLPIITPLLNGLLACNPQPYAVTTQQVGPLGGTIRVGGHQLVIPAGALQQSVTITAEAPSDYVASVRFKPEGLRFARAATLTLDYSNCPAGRLQLLKRVAYTTDQLDILSYLLSRDNLLAMKVSADLEHFSRYAVAW